MGALAPPAAANAEEPYTLPSPTAIESTAFSPDGRYVAAASLDGIVRLWVVGPYPLGELTAGVSFVPQQNVSADGQLVALVDDAGDVEVWDLSDPARPIRVAGLGTWAEASFIGDHRILVTINANFTEMRLWNLAEPSSPAVLGRPFHLTGAVAAAASPDGRFLAIADTGDDAITVWNVNHPASPVKWATITSRQLAGSESPAFAPAFLSDTVLTVLNADGRDLLRWDLSPRGVASPLPALPTHAASATDVPAGAVSCPTTTAVMSLGNSVQLWDTAKQHAVVEGRAIDSASNFFDSIAGGSEVMLMTGSCLLVAATNADVTDDVKVWAVKDALAPRLIAALPTAGPVEDIMVSDEGTRVAAISEPPAGNPNAPNTDTLDVWSLNRTGTTHQLAALQVSSGSEAAEFIPHTHLILFSPATSNAVLPDILDPDPSVTYRSLCATTQDVLTSSQWTQDVPSGIRYEPPC